MVTKRQQLEWCAINLDKWPFASCDYFFMSGLTIGMFGVSHQITKDEWKQERDKMQKKEEMNIAGRLGDSAFAVQQEDDNSWHERGEFPPGGTKCEVFSWGKWVECFFIGVSSHGNGVFDSKYIDQPFDCYNSPSKFRPLRTEREKAIEEIALILVGGEEYAVTQNLAKAISGLLYDAGYRKVKP